MTLAQINPEQAEFAELDRMAEKATALLERITMPVAVREVRQALNDTGLRRKQTDLHESLDVFKQAQHDVRTAREAVDVARTEHARAFAEAASPWALGDFFVTRSNKQFLAVDLDGTPIPEDKQQSLDAAGRKEWAAEYAARQPAVVAAAAALHGAETLLEEARDALTLAEKAVKARDRLLESAAAELGVLAVALKAGR